MEGTRPAATARTGMIDITRIPLKELALINSSVLKHSIERVMRDAETQPHEAVSAFNSAI
jgi:FXSXX-COOH protein